MVGVQDAVHDGVTEVHVGRCHVNFGAKHAAAIRELARLHATEEVEVLLHAAIAVRTFHARSGGHSPTLANLLLRLVIHIRQAFLNELLSPKVKLVEIIGSVMFLRPLETQPSDVVPDRVHIFGILLHGVGVIKTQVGLATVFLSDTEIQTDRFCVADMQIAIRLRRESGIYFRIVFPVLDVFFDNLLNEIHILRF